MNKTTIKRYQPISTTSEWFFELIENGRDTYPKQIEVISSEQTHKWAYAL